MHSAFQVGQMVMRQGGERGMWLPTKEGWSGTVGDYKSLLCGLMCLIDSWKVQTPPWNPPYPPVKSHSLMAWLWLVRTTGWAKATKKPSLWPGLARPKVGPQNLGLLVLTLQKHCH